MTALMFACRISLLCAIRHAGQMPIKEAAKSNELRGLFYKQIRRRCILPLFAKPVDDCSHFPDDFVHVTIEEKGNSAAILAIDLDIRIGLAPMGAERIAEHSGLFRRVRPFAARKRFPAQAVLPRITDVGNHAEHCQALEKIVVRVLAAHPCVRTIVAIPYFAIHGMFFDTVAHGWAIPNLLIRHVVLEQIRKLAEAPRAIGRWRAIVSRMNIRLKILSPQPAAFHRNH